jgi:hypothetical protein
MGGALTYARRYALFALVGIAGEDDLDAPDLHVAEVVHARRTHAASHHRSRSNGGDGQIGHMPSERSRADPSTDPADSGLRRKLSAVLRDHLLRDLESLNSTEDAAMWARRILPAKSTLDEAHARQVEEAFQARITAIDSQSKRASGSDRRDEPEIQPTTGDVALASSAVIRRAPDAIDKTELTHPEPRRIRDKDHLRFVSSQPCIICGRTPADPHHLRFAQSRGLGRKVSDEWVVPLCRGHHRDVHRHGDERAWWEKAGIDPNVAARRLWLQSHPTLPI